MLIEIPYAQGLAETLPPHINSYRDEFGLDSLIEAEEFNPKIASAQELDLYSRAEQHHKEINLGEDITRYEAHSIFIGDQLVCVVSAAYNCEPRPLSIIAYGNIPGVRSAGDYASLVVKRSPSLVQNTYGDKYYRFDFHKELTLVKGEVRR